MTDIDAPLPEPREKAALPPHKLLELLKDPASVHAYIEALVAKSIELFRSGKGDDMLLENREAERVLEHAACAGLSLKRSLISVVLYNISAMYLCFFKFDYCLAYMECFFRHFNDHLRLRNLTPEEAQCVEEFRVTTTLQYCAVLSQHKMHSDTIRLAKGVNLALLRTLKGLEPPAKAKGVPLTEVLARQ
jgi:hypothetical protein